MPIFLWQGAENRTIVSEEPNLESTETDIGKVYKRTKTDEFSESEKIVSKTKDHSEQFWEKENIVKSSWIKSGHLKDAINEKVILKDSNSASNKRINDSIHDADSTDKIDLISSRLSKRSGPLSPIDSWILYKPSNNVNLLENRNANNKNDFMEPPTILRDDGSAEVQLFSENSLNEVWANMSRIFEKDSDKIKLQ